jgi:uncharacterized protein YjiS (DUF1127 family)
MTTKLTTFGWKFRQDVAEWIRRSRSRDELMNLSDRHLHDIGLTRCDVRHEAAKPFWMA